jgi:hypothetical protein
MPGCEVLHTAPPPRRSTIAPLARVEMGQQEAVDANRLLRLDRGLSRSRSAGVSNADPSEAAP